MFTGIVQDIVTVTGRTAVAGGQRVNITLPKAEHYVVGDSILLNGICSTVVALEAATLAVDYMPQTDRLTTAASWQVGTMLNCEAPLTLQTKISGSLVTGHVDGTAQVSQFERTPTETLLTIALAQPLPPAAVAQGSMTIDGVNLTIVAVHQPNLVQVNIIPHTVKHSIIQQYSLDTRVNIEFDYIAKLLLSRA